MVAETRIYFEGDPTLREGFRVFFGELATALGRQPSLIAGDGREMAIADFLTALKKHPGAFNILLIDSEGPDDGRLFESICRPQRVDLRSKDRVFWMVQCMETWFLADVEALRRYYGKEFRESAMPRNPKVEEIPKKDVFEALKAATRTSKNPYDDRTKSKHAPRLLKLIDPALVKQASAHCRRLFESVPKLAQPAL
jgi:hypothetical protein